MVVNVVYCVLIMLLVTRVFSDDCEDNYRGYDDYEDGGRTTVVTEHGVTRVKRYPLQPSPKTLSPEEIRDVRGALKQMLSGYTMENPFTPYNFTEATEFKSTTLLNVYLNSVTVTNSDLFEDATITRSESNSNISSTSTAEAMSTSSIISSETISSSTTASELMSTGLSSETTNTMSTFIYQSNPPDESNTRTIDTELQTEFLTKSDVRHGKGSLRNGIFGFGRDKSTSNATTCATTTCGPTLSMPRIIDLPLLMQVIANLTGEFETNLTQRLNQTLYKMGLPTCQTPSLEPPTTSQYDANYTGAIVAKCFVCGLDVEGVPKHAHCSDAFAGDFLPLVPVDPTARAHISNYRKYCTYALNSGYRYNTTKPRSIFGRWTGGCAVRWTDLTGIYTQRTCRNRLQPMMGRHYASKRMAKLEKSLWHVDNGCIISPMATLLPLSRGISLYARFHACVCTGSWCNISVVNAPWKMINTITLLIIIPVTTVYVRF